MIEQHGSSITRFGDVQEMKNDIRIKAFISDCWMKYLETGVTANDNIKAEEACLELLRYQFVMKENE